MRFCSACSISHPRRMQASPSGASLSPSGTEAHRASSAAGSARRRSDARSVRRRTALRKRDRRSRRGRAGPEARRRGRAKRKPDRRPPPRRPARIRARIPRRCRRSTGPRSARCGRRLAVCGKLRSVLGERLAGRLIAVGADSAGELKAWGSPLDRSRRAGAAQRRRIALQPVRFVARGLRLGRFPAPLRASPGAGGLGRCRFRAVRRPPFLVGADRGGPFVRHQARPDSGPCPSPRSPPASAAA